MAIFNINKNGNLEIEHNLIRYRVPLIEFPTEEIVDIEKDIKRVANKLSGNPLYLNPFRVEIINSSVVYYYDTQNLNSFLYLRGLDFEEKLKYFSSLIEIAKNEDVRTIWNKNNFVLDPYEQNVKAIIYETDYIKLHEDTNALEGLKELILISLTTLDSVVGKPRRTSFIDQEDDIINFAETVLLVIDDIDDLDDYIKTKIIEYEYSNLSEKEKVEYEKNKEGTENSRSGKKGKLPKIRKEKKSKKPQNQKHYGKKKKKSDKKLYIGLGVLVIFALSFNMLLSDSESGNESPNEETPTVENSEESNSETETESLDVEETEFDLTKIDPTEHDEQLLLAYRHSQSGSNEQALDVLEKIGYNNLTEPDQKIMLDIYVKTGNYEKAISLNPMRAESIVNNLLAESQTEKILEIHGNLEESNPYIEFEVAYLQGESNKLVELKDTVKLNGRKEEQITEAYLKLGQKDEARKFAESVGDPDLMQMVQSYN